MDASVQRAPCHSLTLSLISKGGFRYVFPLEIIFIFITQTYAPVGKYNNNNNLLISSAQVSTIRFSNARYIIDRDKQSLCI